MIKNNQFSMLAYTGAVIDFRWWGRIVFDVAGMRLDKKLPAFREHDRLRVAGVIDRTEKELAALRAWGYFTGTPDGQEVKALIEEGFPYQASVGIYPETIEEVKERDSAQVNGGTFQGPGIIIRQSHVREISFAALGADSRTSVTALAASAPGYRQESYINEPADFGVAIKLQLSRGLPVRAAIKAAAQTWPRLFQSYLDQTGYTFKDYMKGCEPAISPQTPFEAKVQELIAQGKTKGEAICQVARNFPELHDDYLNQVNS